MRSCPRCKIEYTNEQMLFASGKRRTYCQSCSRAYQEATARAKGVKKKNSSEIRDGQKKCTLCLLLKNFDCFSPASRGLASLSSRCKPCMTAVATANLVEKEKRRVRIKTYRADNSEVWRAEHSERMNKRRALIKDQSDGSVTPQLYSAYYKQTHCFYCLHETPRELRTTDHKTPITRGGLHSLSNIVMACRDCNLRKALLTAEEFLEKEKRRNAHLSQNNS